MSLNVEQTKAKSFNLFIRTIFLLMKLIFYITNHGLHSGYLIFKTLSESIQDHTDVEVEREIKELVASLGCTNDVSC